jgi:hypothetical protein
MKKPARQPWRELLGMLDGVALVLTALVLSPLGIAVLALGMVVLAGFFLYWFLWEVPHNIHRSLRKCCPVHRDTLDIERLTKKEAIEDEMRQTAIMLEEKEGYFREAELRRYFPHAQAHERLLSLGLTSHYCRACRQGWNSYLRETLKEWHQNQIASCRNDNLSDFSLNFLRNKAQEEIEGAMGLLGFSEERINGMIRDADKRGR